MIQRETEFLPTYIQMLNKYSGGYGFENSRNRRKVVNYMNRGYCI